MQRTKKYSAISSELRRDPESPKKLNREDRKDREENIFTGFGLRGLSGLKPDLTELETTF